MRYGTPHFGGLAWPIRALVAGILLTMGAMVNAAPDAELWERWTAHNPNSSATIDHRAWDEFLARNLRSNGSGINLIPYAQVRALDKSLLNRYLSGLSQVPISRHSRAEQLAYWINLYNALTVKVVLDHYPVESIRDISISPGLFSTGPWGKKLIVVEGETLSLDDIEHRILRPIWRDPRIHYAVNCASIGCPNLQPVAFTAASAQRMLDTAAREYINHPRGALVFDRRSLTASRIYDWFEDDFGGNEQGVIEHLRQYAKPELARQLANLDDIDDFEYDWTLNDASPRRSRDRDRDRVSNTRRRRGSGSDR